MPSAHTEEQRRGRRHSRAAYSLVAGATLFGCREPTKAAPKSDSTGTPVQSSAANPAADGSLGGFEVVYRSIDNGRTWSPFASGIPAGAVIRNFVSRADTTFVATEKHGVYGVERGASAWRSRSEGLPDTALVTAIGVVDERLLIGTRGDGVFVSTNDGGRWKPSHAGQGAPRGAVVRMNTPVRSLLAVKSKVFAGTDNGVYESTDKGDSWRHVFGDAQINGFTLSNGKVYAAVVDGAILSNDLGETWSYIYRADTLHDISNDGEYVYAMTLRAGLLRSNDDGKSWVNVNEGLPAKQHSYAFQVRSVDSDVLVAHWGGLYRAPNRGATWSRIGNGLPPTGSYTSLVVTPLGIFTGLR